MTKHRIRDDPQPESTRREPQGRHAIPFALVIVPPTVRKRFLHAKIQLRRNSDSVPGHAIRLFPIERDCIELQRHIGVTDEPEMQTKAKGIRSDASLVIVKATVRPTGSSAKCRVARYRYAVPLSARDNIAPVPSARSMFHIRCHPVGWTLNFSGGLFGWNVWVQPRKSNACPAIQFG